MTTISVHHKVGVRWMTERDLPEVVRVDEASFEQPWGEKRFRKLGGLRTVRLFVAESQVAGTRGEILGFMAYQLHDDWIELLSIAVDPRYRRYGIGSQMVARLKDKLSPSCRRLISAGVREDLLVAQLFLRRHRFFARDLIREACRKTELDAYIMEFECRELDDGWHAVDADGPCFGK